jgi:CHAT domain-containing protein/Tfp pilus assembly protein PilF
MRVSYSGWSVHWALILLIGWSVKLCGAEPGVLTTAAPVKPTPLEANAAAIVQAQGRAHTAEARGDVPGLAAALNEEADGLLRAHEFGPAEKLRLEVVRLEEEHAGPESLPVADALLNLGWFYNNMARYETAQAELDRCLEIRRKRLGAEAAPVAEVLNALGALEENRNNLTLAETFYEEAIAIQKKALGPQSPALATTWNNLATLYWIMGNYAPAQTLFTQALAVREKVFGPDSLAVAGTLNGLALLDSSLGDYDEAENCFQQVLRIRQARLVPDHPATIKALSELALLYVREGSDARAEPVLARALEVQQKTYGMDHPDVARTLAQLGLLYDRQKHYARAEPLLIQALEIRQRTVGVQHPEYASSLAALARHYHVQGKFDQALALYLQALKVDGDSLRESHPDTVAVASDLACLELELGQRDDAASLIRNVADAQQNALNSVFAFTPERQRMDFEKTIGPYDLPASLDDAGLIAEMVLRTKGVVLDSLLEDEAMARAARDPEVRQLMEKKRLLSARLLREQEDVSGVDFSATPAAVAERAKLEKEEQELESSLAEKGIGSGETRRALATDVDAVREAIPDDAALVEYVVYHRYTGRLNSELAYGAVVLTRQGPPRWIPLGLAAEIDGQVRLYQKYLQRRVHETVLAQVLRGLDQALAEPVLSVLPSEVHRLIISPDGSLNFVSFATLLDARDRFFCEDFELNYVSSGRDLLAERKSIPSKKQLVIFADPDYDHLSCAVGSRDRVSAGDSNLFPPLPGTEREAMGLSQVAKEDGIETVIFRGIAASKANLVRQDSPYVLHLATHGLYLYPDDVPKVPADGPVLAQPMSRSLLALAGASVTLREWRQGNFPTPDNDGLLTAQEVTALNLDHTWLVVLSTCDSGGGEEQAGEGVLGLRRGFAEAGAQNLVMTLWAVNDTGTVGLMEAFYREALKSGDAPGALARVQRASLEDLRKKAGLSEAVRIAGPFILSY